MRVNGHIVSKGAIIGQYENQPIHDFLVYDDGCVLRFSHVAPADRDGLISLSILSDGECLVSPGLVYRRDDRAEPAVLEA
ncbi:MAG: hypothetical protein ACYCPA_08525 [Acidithiobacillus sp.]